MNPTGGFPYYEQCCEEAPQENTEAQVQKAEKDDEAQEQVRRGVLSSNHKWLEMRFCVCDSFVTFLFEIVRPLRRLAALFFSPRMR
jgi:hypothetical protein